MLQTVFWTMLEISLAVSLIIAFVLLLTPVMKRFYNARLRYTVWLILAIRLLIPFHFTLPKAPVTISVPQTAISQTYTAAAPAAPAANSTAANPAVSIETPKAIPSLSPIDCALFLWAAGTLVFALRQWAGFLSMKKKIRRWSADCDYPATADLFEQVKRELGVKKNIRLRICKAADSPMMFGFLHPVVLLPHEKYDEEDLRLIFRHELIHYRHRDLWYKLVLLIANAVHWFNPLVYLMEKAANRDIEIFCDEELVKNTDIDFRKKYSETILSAIHAGFSGNTALSTYFYGGKKTMKDRFQSILSIGSKRRGVLIVCIVFTAAVLAGVFIGINRSGKNKNIQAAASASSAESSSETSPSFTAVSTVADSTAASATVTKRSLAEGGTLIKNDQCNVEIKLPDNWKGRYYLDQSKNDDMAFSCTFLNKVNYDIGGDGSGRIFELFAYPNESAIRPCNVSAIIGQNDQYTFYIDIPSDVQYFMKNDGDTSSNASLYENAEKDYKEMFGNIQGIVEDFLSRNHITAFNNVNSGYQSAASSAKKKTDAGYVIDILYNVPTVSKDTQDKADQFAMGYLLALSKKDWDTIKAESTGEFYNRLKNPGPAVSSDTGYKYPTAGSLIGEDIDIHTVSYFTRGKSSYAYVDICFNDYYCEVKLSESNGSYFVADVNPNY